MMYYGSLLMKYLSPKIVEKLLVIVSKIVYGDLSKYGLPFPSEGPFVSKQKYGKFPVIDLGTIKKIKFGEIQVRGLITVFTVLIKKKENKISIEEKLLNTDTE